jgi:hypothetical protein
LAQLAIAPLFGEIASAAESSFIAPPGELCAGFELTPEPLDSVVGLGCSAMGSFEGCEVASGSSDMGELAADLSTPGCGHSRTLQLLTPFWSWWARRLFKPAAESVAGAQHPFCSGLSSQASKSAHFRRINALRPLYKERALRPAVTSIVTQQSTKISCTWPHQRGVACLSRFRRAMRAWTIGGASTTRPISASCSCFSLTVVR